MDSIKTKNVRDNSSFDQIGLMLDLSRGKVYKVEKIKEMIDVAAKVGFTYINLYIEDLLTLDEYPQYGYLRGKYSDDEIRELVLHARKVNIDLFPAIQTLGHLEHFLRWETNDNLADSDKVLNVCDERTYVFIDVLIKKCKQLFDGTKINIGMDEAFDLGHGKIFRSKNDKSQKELYLQHLKRVTEITKSHGYTNIKIWSDMLFSTYSSADGESLYSTNFKDQIESLDPALELIFWNYWTAEQDTYEAILDAHHKFSDNVSMALGIHTWGFPFYNLLQLEITSTALKACEKKGVKDVLFTMWGDDGSIFNINSTYLGMYETMSHILKHEKNSEEFKALCGLDYDIQTKVTSIQDVGINPLLIIWNDPITNVFMKTRKYDELISIREKTNELLIDEHDDSSIIYNLYLKCMNNDISIYLADNPSDELIEKSINDTKQLQNHIQRLWLEEAKVNALEDVQLRFETKIYRLNFLKQYKDHPDIINIRNERVQNLTWVKHTYNNIAKATRYRW